MALVDSPRHASPFSARLGAATKVASAARHLGGQLLRSKLLLAYVTLGAASGFRLEAMGLAAGLINHFVLLPVYVLLIYLWTRDEPTAAPGFGQSPSGRRDLALIVSLLVVGLAGLVWFWTDGLPAVVMDVVNGNLRGAGWDRGLANSTANAVESILFSLLPALAIVFALFRLRATETGLQPRHLGLGLVLGGLGVGLAYLVKLGFGSSSNLFNPSLALPLVFALFAVQIFINALPEEFIFRGVLLTRLLAWLRNPHHALVLASVLFVALHIPSHVFGPEGATLWDWLPVGYQPTGLVWGYLYYRTRSIWPGVLWHASYGTLGLPFLG